MKRFIPFVVSVIMVVGTLSGCTTKTTEKGTEAKSTEASTAEPASNLDPNEPGWKKNVDKKEKFSWYINFSWFATEWGADVTSKYITEKTGVDVEYVVPAGNEAEKLNTMIASGTLPDFITLAWDTPQAQQLMDSGLVYPLNELAKQYDPYFFTVASEEKLGWYTQKDGNVYGYPNASYSPSDFVEYKDSLVSNQTFLVRKDIYEAIGSPDMTTPEGFLDALKKAKEMFPTVNGQPLIPLGLNEFGDTGNNSLEAYLQNFLAVDFEKDGKIYDRTTDSEYIKWLKTLRKANEDGLIAKDVFIDKRPQMEEKIAQGRYFAMIYQSQDMLSQNTQRYVADPNSAYIAVDFAKNANGKPHTLAGPGISGWTLTMISKNCKDPERAIEFLSYFISEEGQHDITLGPPELWETVDGKDQLKPEYAAIKENDGDKFNNTIGAQDAHWMLMDLAMQEKWTLPMMEPVKQTKEWTVPYVTYTAVYDNIDPATDSAEANNLTKIKTKWGSVLPKLLLATSDDEFDKLMNDFIQFRTENGFDKIQEIRSEKMNENKEKLDMK